MGQRQVTVFDVLIEYGIIILLFFTPVAFGTIEFWSVTVMEIGVFILTLIWILKMFIQKKVSIVESPINLVIILFLILVTFQLMPFPDPLISLISPNTKRVFDFYTSDFSNLLNLKTFSLNPWVTRGELLKLLTYGMVYFLVASNFNGKKKKNKLILSIMIIGFIEAFYGIIQYVGGDRMIFHFTLLHHEKGRLISTFPNPDHFSAFIKMCIFLSLGYLIYFFDKENVNKNFEFYEGDKLSKRGKKKRWKRILNILREIRNFAFYDRNGGKSLLLASFLIVMIVALIFTKSRTGILSFLVCFVFFGLLTLLRGSLKRHLWILSLILIITLAFGSWIGLASVFDRYFNFSLKEDLEEGRLSIWKSTYNIFKDYPVLGTGFGSFVYIFPSYSLRSNQAWVNHAHNDWLELLSDTGIIGFLIIFSGAFYLNILCLKKVLKIKNYSQIWIFLGGYTSILSIIIHSFADFNLRSSANAFLVAVIIGLLVSFAAEPYEKIRDKR